MLCKKIHTARMGKQFIPVLFNGDMSDLDPSEETRIEQEHFDYVLMGEEEFGEENFTNISYSIQKEEPIICKCDITGLLSECYEVDVYALAKERTIEPAEGEVRGITNMDGTVERFTGEY